MVIIFESLFVVFIVDFFPSIHSPSGGNAGNAVAVAGKTLGIPTEIYVPKTTLPMMIKIIESSNAKVIVTGNNWNEANEVAKEACQKDQNAKYIPAFDDPLIWEGHSFMIDEIVRQFQENPETKDIIPDALITCVGGGGLLRGMQLGLQRNNWLKTKIFAVETKGAASFAALKKHGKGSRLEKIDTIASTLGALQVIDCTLDSPIATESVVVSDADAVHACLSYANEFRMLVEPSCGSSLSLLYRSEFYERYLSSYENILMIVCGGSAVSLELLQDWKKRFQL